MLYQMMYLPLYLILTFYLLYWMLYLNLLFYKIYLLFRPTISLGSLICSSI